MPLQIRRGTEAERQTLAVPLVSGELLWITDDQKLYIGNGTTLAKDLSPVTGYGDAEAKDAAASIFTSGTHSGISFSYDGSTSIDATVSYPALLQNLSLNSFNINGTGNIAITGSVTATSFVGDYKGTISADDSTILVDALNGSINLSGTVKGDIIPNQTEVYDIGSFSNKFRNLHLSANGLYLENAHVTATGTTVNLPVGSTVGGVPIGTTDLISGSNYNINIVGDDSSLIVDSATNTVSADIIYANAITGTLLGDVKGSVFGDNSTLLVDGVSSVIVGDISNNITNSDQFTGATIALTGLNSFGVPTGLKIVTDYDEDYPGSVIELNTHATTAVGQSFIATRARGTSASPAPVQTNDSIFKFAFFATDSTSTGAFAGAILASVDDTPTAGNIPTRLELYTTDGSGNPALGLKIDKDQVIGVAANTVVAGAGSGEADISSVSTYLKIVIGGTEYAIPAYAINP